MKQRVSATGCTVFGLPPKMVARDLLFFGARPVDGSMIDAPGKRPHALQVPLDRASK